MKAFLILVFSCLLLIACDSSVPPGEKAAEGTTGESQGIRPDTSGHKAADTTAGTKVY